MDYLNMIESEWDYEKNSRNGLKPDKVTKGSHRKAWWRCETYGHSYEMSVYNRITLHHNCPYCAGNKVLAGFNDFESQHPDLMKEWDWVENDKNGIKPDEIAKTSGMKVNWLCNAYKHSYIMSILDKVHEHGCPYCAGKKILVGFNDLLTSNKEIIDNEWDWVKNESNNIHPTDFTRGSNKTAWFKCTKNHSYEMRIIEKIMKKQGCPYCAGKKVLKGYNDLASQHPDLMKEWDWIENDKKGIKPDEVTSGSNKMVSWICNHCNGKYIMTVYHKVKGTCPFCSNRKLLTGFNDLQSRYPD